MDMFYCYVQEFSQWPSRLKGVSRCAVLVRNLTKMYARDVPEKNKIK